MKDKINMGVTICRSKLGLSVCIFFLPGQSSPKLNGTYSVHWIIEFNIHIPGELACSLAGVKQRQHFIYFKIPSEY